MKNLEIISYLNRMIENTKYIEKKEVLINVKTNLNN